LVPETSRMAADLVMRRCPRHHGMIHRWR
jgi:hypothetical protein